MTLCYCILFLNISASENYFSFRQTHRTDSYQSHKESSDNKVLISTSGIKVSSLRAVCRSFHLNGAWQLKPVLPRLMVMLGIAVV